MIKQVNNKSFQIAEKIYHLFQSSYLIEAKILAVEDFPPLNRTINNIINSVNNFYAFFSNKNFIAIIEIDCKGQSTHIQSLVVSPVFFRKGIGNKMVDFALKKYSPSLFSVETGVDNAPARSLYEKYGFLEVKQWDTDHNIKKVRYELNK